MAKVWARGRLIQLIIIISIKICAPSGFSSASSRAQNDFFSWMRKKTFKRSWVVCCIFLQLFITGSPLTRELQWKGRNTFAPSAMAPLAAVTSGRVVIHSVDLISRQIYWKPFFLPNGGLIQQDILINYLFSCHREGEERATAQELSTLLDLPRLGPILSYW